MSYIVVENQGEIQEWGVRLLGLSEKSPEKIGRFGTGLKEAIALLAREGLFPVIFSGDREVSFCVLGEPEEIHYCWDGEWKGLGISPLFGRHDWNDMWQVFREVICNAIDEGEMRHDVYSGDPCGEAGKTRIFLPCNYETLQAYGKIHERLLMLSQPEVLYENGDVKVYKKQKEPMIQVYHREVWVMSGRAEEHSIWDWEFTSLKLNESRSADWNDVITEIMKGCRYLPVEMIQNLLCYDNTPVSACPFEIKCIDKGTYWYADEVHWKEAFVEEYGELGVLCDSPHECDKVRIAGYEPVTITNSALASVMRRSGVKVPAKVLRFHEQKFDQILEPLPAQQELFNRIYRDLAPKGTMERPVLRIFVSETDSSLGKYHAGTCYVNQTVLGSAEEIHTMVEEICHYLSGAPDNSRQFQNALIGKIVKLGRWWEEEVSYE
jgi:hypothetical protein